METGSSLESFRVKTDGYTEQFSNYNAARQTFTQLKRQKTKEALGAFKIVLEQKQESGGWVTVDSISVKG